jgi:hypothetical protein
MAIVGISVISVLSFAYAGVYAATQKLQSKVDFLNTIAQIQLNIANTVNDSNSWQVTLSDSNHNSAMNCIATKTCTAAMEPTGFVLWPAQTTNYSDSNLAEAIYNGINPSAGYTLSGQPCSRFSASGNGSCPIHVNLKWSTPGCTPAPCSPSVEITADILFRPGANSTLGSINESHLALNFRQKSVETAIPCSGIPPAKEVALCQHPPYPGYKMYCTATGFRCGRVYY